MRYTQLELAITDYCNLNCPLCAQGIPRQKNKQIMSLEYLKKISALFKPHEFNLIKISGGEPTSHPQFEQICGMLHKYFPVSRYILITNGYQLEKFMGCIDVFDEIFLSNYPGLNDYVYNRLINLRIRNLVALKKEVYTEIKDIYHKNNFNKRDIWRHCDYNMDLKVVQDRIYPCCNAFGLCLIRESINPEKISVLLDRNWRENIVKIDLEPFCKICWVDVNLSPIRLKKYMNNIKKRLKYYIKKIFMPKKPV